MRLVLSLAVSAVVVVGGGVFAWRSQGVVPTDARCQAAKLEAAGRKAKSLLACQASAAGRGRAVDPRCVRKAEEKFAPTFEKAEEKAAAKGGQCTTMGDAPTIETAIDLFVSDVASQLAGVGRSRCRASMLGATGRAARKLLELYAKEPSLTSEKRESRRQAVLERLAMQFSRAEKLATAGEGGCPTTDDAALIRAKLEPFAEEIAAALSPRETKPPRPNIVLILTDDQRWDTLEYMPQVMSRLAGEGILFTNSFVTSALCSPSRSSLLTGRYAHNHGVHSNNPVTAGAAGFKAYTDTHETVATALKAAGYTNGYIGKYLNGYHTTSPHIPAGWDDFRAFLTESYYNYKLNENGVINFFGAGEDPYSTDVLGEKAVEFIRRNYESPFFLVYAPTAPHAWPGPRVVTPANRHAGNFDGIELWRPPNFNGPDVSDKPPWVGDAKNAWTEEMQAQRDAFRQGQLESLLAVDEAVGKILDEIDTLGLRDNTIVIFTSDHGFMWGEHWLAMKVKPYEEALRVPLVIRYPAMIGVPRADDDLVLNIDITPTILDLAGATLDPEPDGRSLVPLLDGSQPAWREDFLFETWGEGDLDGAPAHKGVRSREYKYIRTETDPAFEELYDLDVNRYEMDNLAADPKHSSVLARMRTRLTSLLEK